jgi:hypothetical protein
MSATDFGWYLKTFDALMGFLYLHNVSVVQKPIPLRRNDWDWFLDRYHYFTFGPYNLLAGYAIETMIKCCLDNAGWTGNIITHDLEKLAKELEKAWNMTVPANIVGYLKDFQIFIEWKGKYPMPSKPTADQGPPIGIGGEQFTKIRDTWTFFYNELKKRDPLLADSNLVTYRYDSGQLFDDSMEAFDVLDQIVKYKLAICGKYVLYKKHLLQESFVKFMKWLEKLGIFKGYNIGNVRRRETRYLQEKLRQKKERTAKKP